MNTTDIHEFVSDFETEHEELLALIERHQGEEGFTEAALALCKVEESTWAEYLDKKEASEELPSDAQLVPDEDWVDYVKEMLEDMGEVRVPSYVVVDWEATADNIQQDYSSIDIGNNTYWWRD